MRSSDWDDVLLAEHRAHLRVRSARAAFDRMVALAVALPTYECAPGWRGNIREFRYVDRVSGERPFALIVNRADLLLYVRKSGLARVPGGLAALKSRFRTVSETRREEWQVPIKGAEDAQDHRDPART